jgi:hypothetical protein
MAAALSTSPPEKKMPTNQEMISSIVILKRFARLVKEIYERHYCPECGVDVPRDGQTCSGYCQFKYTRDIYPREYDW